MLKTPLHFSDYARLTLIGLFFIILLLKVQAREWESMFSTKENHLCNSDQTPEQIWRRKPEAAAVL